MTTYAHATPDGCGGWIGHVTADARGECVLYTGPLTWPTEEEAEAAAVWGWTRTRDEWLTQEAA